MHEKANMKFILTKKLVTENAGQYTYYCRKYILTHQVFLITYNILLKLENEIKLLSKFNL